MNFSFPSVLVGLSFLGLVGCAAKPAVVAEARKGPGEDREMLLQQRVQEKEVEIERLAAKMEVMQAQQEMDKKTGDADDVAAQKLPRVKLSPKPAVSKLEDPAEELLGHEEAVSLADSRHETMHWYFRGLTLLEHGQYEEAVESFAAFLKSSPRHVYADRAQFWVGEARYRSKDYPMAIIAFNRLEGEFPDSFRRVEAGYKKSIALEKVGRAEEAVVQLKELIRRFPRHPLTSEASARLASLEVGLAKKQFQ